MKFFVSTSVDPAATLHNSLAWRLNDQYLELSIECDDVWLVHYYARKDTDSWWVLSCLSPHFDALAGPMDQTAADEVSSQWRVMTSLMMNTYDDELRRGGLLSMDDPDDNARKWFVGAEVELFAPSLHHMFGFDFDEFAWPAANRAMRFAIELFNEIDLKPLPSLGTRIPTIVANGWWGDNGPITADVVKPSDISALRAFLEAQA